MIRYRSGGSGPTGVSNETWTYIGPQTAIFANFGHGCAGSLGLPSLTATLPQVGTNFTLTIGNLPLATTSTLLAIGLSNVSQGTANQSLVKRT